MSEDQWQGLVIKLARCEDALLRQGHVLESGPTAASHDYLAKQWRIALSEIGAALDQISNAGVCKMIYVASARAFR